MAWAEPITLKGQHVTLVPLSAEHQDDLIKAVCDGNLFELWYTPIPSPDKMQMEIERRLKLLEQGAMISFAVISNELGRVVGLTSYMQIDPVNHRLEIGSTWYAKSVQRSALNTECKFLLLQHAFETLKCIAVEFRTSIFNHQSRGAIERLGAKQDGILRNHARHKNGTLRDTVVYSIIFSEWPVVKSHLRFQLDRPR
jgi:N-acetyltransferase